MIRNESDTVEVEENEETTWAEELEKAADNAGDVAETLSTSVAEEEEQSTQTLVVYKESLIEAAWGQFRESEGNSHPLVIDGFELLYKPEVQGSYRDADKISAYDVVSHINFDAEKAEFGMHEALTHFEGVVSEVEIGGEVYDVVLRHQL